MSVATKGLLVEVDGQPLPSDLLENFEKADLRLRELYGFSPGAPALFRLWLACGTSANIKGEFELAVLDIKKSPLTGEDCFDEDAL
ncbi:MAG TPA: hypothetical protein VMI53_04325 [Opitutaceae bacterium]|nr:hypothetical protein [Opitutaceae bacterium]